MRINHLNFRTFASLCVLLGIGLVSPAGAQTSMSSQASVEPVQQTKPTVKLPVKKGPEFVTGSTSLYCGGFIQYAPAPNGIQIIGGEEEQEQRVYSAGDYVYINVGSQDNIRVGQEYVVIRPRGQFRSSLSRKDGWLGVYTQELGSLRVVNVKADVSVALVTQSCDDMLLGDLLRAKSQRVAPFRTGDEKLDRFADPSGKQNGRIVLARDSREMLSRDQVVFIDLGTEDNIKPGDQLTIYRPLGSGNITSFRDEEITPTASGGFQSDDYRGGKFSNKAQRVQDANSTGIYGPMITSPDILNDRPPMPRKIVGEMVVIGVQQRTASAVITKVAQEIHTGDFVELQ